MPERPFEIQFIEWRLVPSRTLTGSRNPPAPGREPQRLHLVCRSCGAEWKASEASDTIPGRLMRMGGAVWVVCPRCETEASIPNGELEGEGAHGQ